MMPVYKSIDIRTACITEEDRWRNILTVIRFAHETKQTTEEKQAGLATNLGKISTEKFKVVYETLGIDEWTRLKDWFLQGEIKVGGLTVVLDDKKDPDALSGNLSRYPSYAVCKNEWNVLEAYSTTNRDPQQVLRVVESDAIKAGFRSIYQAINALLGARYTGGMTTDVIVLAPALARFSIDRLDPNQRLLSITAEIHKNLRNCMLNVIIQENGRQRPEMQEVKFKKQTSLNPDLGIESRADFRKIESGLELPEIRLNDVLDIRIVAGDIEVFDISGPIRSHYTAELLKVKPLFDIFLEFRDDFEFDDLLLHADRLKVKRKNKIIEPQEVFARSVCWLLNFLGFTSVKMDEREILQEPETKVEIGSVDILAYHELERVFVLGNCSLKPPKPEDIITLRDLKKKFSEGLLEGRVNRVVAAFFSLGEELLQIKESARQEGVKVFGASDISQILSQFREGSFDLRSWFY